MTKKQELYTSIDQNCCSTRADHLKSFLDKLVHFEKAPASSKLSYHHAWEGGLIGHIMEMIGFGLPYTYDMNLKHLKINTQELVTVCVLHDICKVGDSSGNPFYVPNILKSGKVSDKIPFEIEKLARLHCDLADDRLQTGDSEVQYLFNRFCKNNLEHGEMSLALVYTLAPELYDSLTPDEHQAVEFHDGAYGKAKYSLGGKECPLQIVAHCIDMLSSRSSDNE